MTSYLHQSRLRQRSDTIVSDHEVDRGRKKFFQFFSIFFNFFQFFLFSSPEITSELRVRELLDRPSVRELLASRARTAELDSRIQIAGPVQAVPAGRKPDDDYPPPPSYESVAVYALYEPPPPYQERP